VRVNPNRQGRSQPADLRFPDEAGLALGSLSLSPSVWMLSLHRRPVRMRASTMHFGHEPCMGKNVIRNGKQLPVRAARPVPVADSLRLRLSPAVFGCVLLKTAEHT